MTCEELRRLLEDEGTASSEPARAHLASCPACTREAENWAAVLASLRDLGEEPAPPFLHARIMAHVRAEATSPVVRRWRPLHGWRAPALAAAGGAIVILGLGLYQTVRPPAAMVDKVARASAEEADAAVARDKLLDGEAPSRQAAPAELPQAEKTFAARPQPGVESRAPREEMAPTGKAEPVAEDGNTTQAALADVRAAGAVPPPAPVLSAAEPDRHAASLALEEARPTPLAGLLRTVENARKGSDLVRCRLQVEGDEEVVELHLPADQAPPVDEVWLVTVHPDGQLDLRDSQGERQLAPLVLQQSIGQQRQMQSGRYRLSQAPVPPTP
jgi:hypothetical protein